MISLNNLAITLEPIEEYEDGFWDTEEYDQDSDIELDLAENETWASTLLSYFGF